MKKTVVPENDKALKHLVGPALLKKIAASLSEVDSTFDVKGFLAVQADLESLEMKPRVRCIRDALRQQLPASYPKALQLILQSLKTGKLRGFDVWPYAEFIQNYGLEEPQISLLALKEVTKAFTSEWAVRPFIQRYPKETMRFLLQCAQDKDVSVRRWASEGTRPRLPWGERLQEFVKDPSPTLPVLEKLKFDPELYVRKSVANHLNDIAKDHPEVVVQALRRWKNQARGKDVAKVDWIILRSLRTLIKQGHPGALQLIGVSKAKIKIEKLKIHQTKIKMGERLVFEITLRSKSPQNQKLVVDYVIHFVKANQKRAPKVFKLKTFHLPARGTMKIEKSHHIKKITTRDYYPGLHSLEIQINGTPAGKLDWTLKL